VTDLDAYGNPLPAGTSGQIAKELALYRRIGRQLQREADKAEGKEVVDDES
jgi:hypothetical protein